MRNRDIKIFTIGYSDNTSTKYILEYLTSHGVKIDGTIFIKNKFKSDWKRVIKKVQMRGFIPAMSRIYENLFVRRKQITHIYHQFIENVFFVDEINSVEVRDILIDNEVTLLILTSTPIIKSIILDIKGLTIINGHTGWLPKYRGFDANLKALRDGQKPGVSIHKVTKKIDGGEVYLRESFFINNKDDILKQMDEKELHLCGKLLVKAINLKKSDELEPIVKEELLGKYEPSLTKNEREKIIQNFKTSNRIQRVLT